MAFLGKLFSKESCVICGTDVGALHRKKIADGIICKECASKCSPWFDSFKESTQADIEYQLREREVNKQRIADFHPDKIFGEFGAVLVDSAHGTFCAVADVGDGLFSSRKKITSIADIADRNPDIIPLDCVRDVDLDVTETRREEKQTKDGQQVSYDPKHWLYMYDFALVIHLDHPYIPIMRIMLNNGTVQIHTNDKRVPYSMGRALAAWLLDEPRLDIRNAPAVFDDNSLSAWLLRGDWEMPDYSYGFRVTLRNWDDLQKISYFLAMAGAVRYALLTPNDE